jgi:predicted Rossmann fold flavoprotein
MQKYDLVVIGAGAAGLIASARAAELGLKVVVLEKMDRAGRKLLITGKGRCNITNSAEIKEFISNIHPDGRFLYPAFKNFFSDDIIYQLNELGVGTTLERGGRYFPTSDEACDVVNALLSKAEKSGVKIIYKSTAKGILVSDKSVIGVKYLNNNTENIINVDRVIVCTGGKSYPGTGSSGDGYTLAKSLGHTIIEPRPSLVPLMTKEPYPEKMQGLTLKNVEATLIVDNEIKQKEFGDMLFTHFGLSGPIILTLSRLAVEKLEKQSGVEINIDFKPALDNEKLDQRLMRDINEHGKMKLENLFRFWLPLKAIPVFLDILNINPNKLGNQVSGKERKNILDLLKGMKFTITGHRGFKEAIITNGGISTDEINQKTMESKLINGLFFAGEVIDLDANTGGYNLQIAFSTGWLAAKSSV